VYQSQGIINNKGNPIVGPVRVLPGRLSVSRTFGDCVAKMEKYGGNPNCIIADPEIYMVPNSPNLDYVLIASDGIFDRLSTEETAAVALEEMRM
jgi:protein phosphatase PTC2/3